MSTEDKNKQNEILENWVHQYANQLYSWAFHKTFSKEIAEDLVQETFLSATKNFEQCRNKDQPKSWLFSILNNKIMDHFRKAAKSFQVVQTPFEKDSEQHIDQLYNQNDNWTDEARTMFAQEEVHLLDNPKFNFLLEKCLEALPANWKIAILSKYILEKNGKEICQELEISPSNYWQVIRRAKLALKICLDKNWKE